MNPGMERVRDDLKRINEPRTRATQIRGAIKKEDSSVADAGEF